MDIEPKENSDLLRKRNKAHTNGNLSHEEPVGPPDGGFRAIAVVVGSFLTNGLLFGVINSYSVIYTVLEKDLIANGVPNAESRAALVGGLTMGTTFFISPVSGIVSGILGLRTTAMLGGIIATTGMLLSSFVSNNVDALYFTYGIMYGLGASFAYIPSLAILGHYFKKHLGIVNGIVTIGSSVFTVIMPPLMQYMIENYGLDWLFRLLAVITFGLALCGMLFKPIPSMLVKPPREKGSKALFLSIVDVQIWKKRKYLIWALSMPVALFGYFVPYVHIKKFIEIHFTDVNQNLPLQCIAITSGMGRLIFGWLADKPGIDRILLQQISFYVIGILTIILPFVRNFGLLIAISLGMGLFDGAFISLIGPIAFELCGGAHAAQAIGCMLGVAATPLSIGPPIAGLLYGLNNNSYTVPFILAGISPLVGATLMFAVRFYRPTSNRGAAHTNGVAGSPTGVRVERSPDSLLNKEANHQTTL
ncbi:monocarboxylate transporter 10-like protein kar [Anticarsia gemmatalis]|uniref:monocarboxylate transporter 10-like protein kar n=1 Tax=Anticarsia gemmatalis TaxID=129554 RepID=UPI003F759CAD